MTFLHLGVPTKNKVPGSNFIEGLGVHVTDPKRYPYRIEWLYFEPDSPMHESIKTKTHAAYLVDDLDDAIKGHAVICQPFSPAPGTRLAFIQIDNAVLELVETKPCTD